ncbi:MAG: hypothetical protein K6T83_07595 [Alicyclobacillus sp.]|nr:hypothetical protein [Alicyclobacillus sp.]
MEQHRPEQFGRALAIVTRKIAALKQAIDETLAAIADGRDRVERIAEATNDEVMRLETEMEMLKQQCLEAIDTVERLEIQSRRARERLLVVNRDVRKSTEIDMKQAYENAQRIQLELGHWQEREAQLRHRRDDVSRRLKALRATAEHAEILMMKFNRVTEYLGEQIYSIAKSMEMAEMGSLLGVQLLQMQEEERRRLAKRLHDGPMQTLASAAMRMQVDGNCPDGIRLHVRRQMNDVIGDLRTIVFDLRPPLLDDLGLVPTLKRYSEQWAHRMKVKVAIRLVGLERNLTPTEKVTIFRGVQEALKNVADHAQATEVVITLTYAEAALIVEVTDNGVGMGDGDVDWVHWVEQGKLGLSMCRQRLEVLGGTLNVGTYESRGTRFVIQLPMIRGNAS